MARNIDMIAGKLGAKVMAEVPDVGPGAFGASRLGAIVQQLRSRLIPSQGRRAGRPTDAKWVHHPKVPMTQATERRLARLAARASSKGRKISPMQLAAQILESAVAGLTEQ
jgi:hypothetical protein